jgi:hypothetical protein
MGQKVNPIGLRLGINRTWDSRWFANAANTASCCTRTSRSAKYLMKKLKQAGVSSIVIERPHKKCRVTIHSARPGVVIGKKGADIEKLRKKLAEDDRLEVHLNIVEVRKPEIDATLVAENIAQQLERRVAFRRAMKRACSRPCVWAPRASASTARAVSAAPKSRAWNGTAKAACRCTRCAPMSTTARRRSQDDLRHMRRQGLDLQGRNPGARSDGAGQEAGSEQEGGESPSAAPRRVRAAAAWE